MKKILFTLALCAFAASVFAAAAANEKVVLNGTLTGITPKKAVGGLTTKEWVKGWGLAGSAGFEKGILNMKHGLIYGFYVHSTAQAKKLVLTVKATALAGTKNNKLDGYFSTCVREIGNKAPFRHEKRTKFGPYALTAAAKEFKVEYNVAPYEQGYVYIGGTNLAISSIRIVTTQAK